MEISADIVPVPENSDVRHQLRIQAYILCPYMEISVNALPFNANPIISVVIRAVLTIMFACVHLCPYMNIRTRHTDDIQYITMAFFVDSCGIRDVRAFYEVMSQ